MSAFEVKRTLSPSCSRAMKHGGLPRISRSCRSCCANRNQNSETDSSARPRCAILYARGQWSETTMRNPILSVAIAFVLVAPCTALAQSPSLNFQKIEHEYKEQKPDGTVRDPQSGLPTGKRMHKPLRVTTPVGSASPALTTQNKPINPTVNPALQGNKLGGSTGPTVPPKPTQGNVNR
jgi:hypothetical protein